MGHGMMTPEKIKIAEVLTLCGIKHHEMSAEHHRYKGRIVYRGDAIRDERHQYVLLEDTQPRQLHSLGSAPPCGWDV